jgi:hypothetical protein
MFGRGFEKRKKLKPELKTYKVTLQVKSFVWRASIMRFRAVLVSAPRRLHAGLEPAGEASKKARQEL